MNNESSTQQWTVICDWNSPQTFNLISPINDDTVFVSKPEFCWQRALDSGSGIEKYQLWIDNNLNMDNISSQDTCIVISTDLADGQHTWFVKAFDKAGNYRNSKNMGSLFIKKVASISIVAPDTSGSPEAIIDVPIWVEDLTGEGIMSLTLTVETDTSILFPTNAITSGTILSGWGNVTTNINGGSIIIAAAGTVPLAGNGTLIFIRYQVNLSAQAGDSSMIHFKEAIFNEGEPFANSFDGTFVVNPGFRISGLITYYSNSEPIANCDLMLGSFQTTSSVDGNFEFSNVPSGNYDLAPMKQGDKKNSISAFDASKILRYAVGLESLQPYQMIAADVSGNGSISSFDASYILRYAVGLITEFPVGSDWIFIPTSFEINDTNWNSAPSYISYSPLNSDKENQDFKGIVVGDVTGNWSVTNLLSDRGSVTITIRNLKIENNNKITIPLNLNFEGVVNSGSFVIEFNDSKLKFISYNAKKQNVEDFLIELNHISNELICAFASAQSFSNKDMEIELVFEAISGRTINDGGLSFCDFILNDLPLLETSISIEQEPKVPDHWHLGQNYPNPFNSSCIFEYYVPEKAHLTIAIYNLMGQRIKTIVDGEVNAGIHKVLWNGLDDNGKKVGSGIYIYKMRSREFSELKKMLLVQ